MVIVWGSVETSPQHLQRALELSLEHVRRSRTEPGCLLHSAHIDAEHPQRIVFFEQWQDLEALSAHFSVPESSAFVAALSELAERPPSIDVFSAEPVPMATAP